jgi:hypothetical protein
MFCTNCQNPFATPYQSLAVPAPTSAPCPTVPVQPQYIPTTGPISSLAVPLYQYQNVNQLPTQYIYGDQGQNGNIVCGQRPLVSVTNQPMWNTPPHCVRTESRDAQNVANYDTFVADFSVRNPVNQRILPTLQALLEPSNIELIKNTIGDRLSEQFGFPVGIEDTVAFRQTINDVANENPAWMYDVQNGLPLLNNVIVNREFVVHQVALRQQLLYEKYIIRNDRQKFMPYGQSDHVVKGETINDPSSYTLNQKTPISYDCFLTQANLWCKK